MAATAQSVAVKGCVADAGSHESLPFASVALMGIDDTLDSEISSGDSVVLRSRKPLGCTTNEEGCFVFQGIPKGSYRLKVSFVGYDVFDTMLMLASVTDMGTIGLKRCMMLKEVSIVSTRPLFSTDGEKIIYNTSDDPSVQTGTAADALQNAPGIEVDADGNITLHGTQEVSVWINNRESKMTSEALKQYIKSLPANAIQQIQVITNPSAKYGGSRPVVNIIMEHKGLTNQFLSIGANANSRPEAEPWISYIFNNRRWEADIYASLGYSHNVISTTGETHLMTERGDSARSDSYRTDMEEKAVSPLLSVDLAYHPDSLNTIALWLGAFPRWTGWEAATDCRRRELLYRPGDYSYSEQRRKSQRGAPSAGLYDGIWLEHIFDYNSGHSVSGGYFGGVWLSDSLVDVSRYFLSAISPDWAMKEQHTAKEWLHGVEVNYILPWGSENSVTGLYANELEAGLEGEYSQRAVAVCVDSLGADGTFSKVGWLSHLSERQQFSGDVYASFTHRWHALSAKAGLRASLSSGSMAYQEASDYSYSQSRLTWAPSLHVTYTTEKQHTFSIGYTLRSIVPETDAYTRYRTLRIDDFSMGNPLLKLGTSHRFEAKWNRYFDKYGSVELNAYHVAQLNKTGELTDVVFDSLYYMRIVSFTHPINIGSASATGIDLNLVYRPSAFVSVRFNASLFYDYIDIQYRPSEAAYSNGMLCYQVRLNAWVKLWEKLQLFSNIYYRSPTQNVLSTQMEYKGVDAGLNADLLHHALSLNLNVNDLFNWNSWTSVSCNPFLGGEKQTKNLSRYVSLGIVLRLGEMGLEHSPVQHRRGRTSD